MKTLKMVYHEKLTKERDDGSPVSLEFRGRWDNNPNEPKITLRITECNEESSQKILEDLELKNPGGSFFLTKQINPQIQLDKFFEKAEKRRTPQIDNFKAEIEDFDGEMISERYDSITETLDEMIKAGEEGSKRFDFYFDCFGVIYEKRVGYPTETTKEEYIKNHSYEEAINNHDESVEENTGDIDDYEDADDSFEEE